MRILTLQYAEVDMIETWDAKRFKDEILKKNSLVAVEFYGKRGGLELDYGSKLESVAKGFSDKMVFGKVDTDREEALAEKYAVRSIPTLMVFCCGKGVAEKVGDTDERELSRVISNTVMRIEGRACPKF